tara:strand:+ start:14265 stop:14648 length:384 start_codon:yes stop_codon:yes gene_type:complete
MTSTIRLFTLDTFDTYIPKKYLYGFEFETPTFTPYPINDDYIRIEKDVLFKIIDDYSNFIYERIKNSRISRNTKKYYLGILRNNLGVKLLISFIFKTLNKDKVISKYNEIKTEYIENKKVEFSNSTI